MRTRKDGFSLDPEELRLLVEFDYEVEQVGGVVRVRPPATSDWLRRRGPIRREIEFVREHPEEALALSALSRLDRLAAFHAWRGRVVRGGPPLCAA